MIGRVGHVGIIGAARVSGFAHLFNKAGSDGTAKGNIVVQRDALVWGVVYEINDAQLEKLDVIEGGYRRGSIGYALRSGEHGECWSYFAELIDDELMPTPEYLQHYVAGIREHDIPGEYLEEVMPDWYKNY